MLFLDEISSRNATAPFKIYQDNEEEKYEEKSTHSIAAPFTIYQDDEQKDQQSTAPFTIYQDKEIKPEMQKSRKPVAPIPIFCDEENDKPMNSFRRNKPVPLTTRLSDDGGKSESTTKLKEIDDDKENSPPENEQYHQHKIPTKGPLLHSEKVLYAPLDVQEKVLDEDEREQDMAIEQEVKLSRCPSMPADQTMAMPTAEDFAEMAKMISTPMNGRRFIPEEDEFTCAVQLAFKKPLPVSQPERNVSPDLQEETKKNEEPNGSVQTLAKNQIKKQGVEARYHNAEHVDESNERTLPMPVPENPMAMMSPIMETSREYNYKSSSSSSESQWQMTLASNKSNWNGNNTTSGANLPQSNNTHNAITGVSMIYIVPTGPILYLIIFYHRIFYHVNFEYFDVSGHKNTWINVAFKINILKVKDFGKYSWGNDMLIRIHGRLKFSENPWPISSQNKLNN